VKRNVLPLSKELINTHRVVELFFLASERHIREQRPFPGGNIFGQVVEHVPLGQVLLINEPLQVR